MDSVDFKFDLVAKTLQPSDCDKICEMFNIQDRCEELCVSTYRRFLLVSWGRKSIELYRTIPVKHLSSQLTHSKLSLNSRQAHLRTLILLTANSQDDSHCKLAVSYLWVCNSHHELVVSCSWDYPMSSPCRGSSELTVRVANLQKAHSVSSSCEFTVS